MNRCIDHTNLSQTATETEIRRLCEEARQHEFFAVCINPIWVARAAELLADATVRICSVAGFPLGSNKTESKVNEAILAVDDGAHEIDMVANIGWLVADQFEKAEQEIRKMRHNLPDDILLKVIIECNQLSGSQQASACRAVIDAGAEFVKTGTGFFGAVSVEQVATLVRVADDQVRVKAAGGIRAPEQARALLAAGATRLGSSNSLSLIADAS